MMFADVPLSRRLERAEGYACAQHAAAHGRLAPDSGVEWMEHSGAFAVFDGRRSPITQAFGLGLSEPLTASILEVFEAFFESRGAHVDHEMSPFAGVEALYLLSSRGYRPIEISSVLSRSLKTEPIRLRTDVRVRVIGPDESDVWTDTCLRGWAHLPELREVLQDFGQIALACDGTRCFLAEIEGTHEMAACQIAHLRQSAGQVSNTDIFPRHEDAGDGCRRTSRSDTRADAEVSRDPAVGS
jgi:hypothetical protein